MLSVDSASRYQRAELRASSISIVQHSIGCTSAFSLFIGAPPGVPMMFPQPGVLVGVP